MFVHVLHNLIHSVVIFFAAKGIKYLFPVQARTFQIISDGSDVITQASKFSIDFFAAMLIAWSVYLFVY